MESLDKNKRSLLDINFVIMYMHARSSHSTTFIEGSNMHFTSSSVKKDTIAVDGHEEFFGLFHFLGNKSDGRQPTLFV